MQRYMDKTCYRLGDPNLIFSQKTYIGDVSDTWGTWNIYVSPGRLGFLYYDVTRKQQKRRAGNSDWSGNPTENFMPPIMNPVLPLGPTPIIF